MTNQVQHDSVIVMVLADNKLFLEAQKKDRLAAVLQNPKKNIKKIWKSIDKIPKKGIIILGAVGKFLSNPHYSTIKYPYRVVLLTC